LKSISNPLAKWENYSSYLLGRISHLLSTSLPSLGPATAQHHPRTLLPTEEAGPALSYPSFAGPAARPAHQLAPPLGLAIDIS